jgi:hypothetical protein
MYPSYYISSTVQASALDDNVYYTSNEPQDNCPQGSLFTQFAAPIYNMSYQGTTSYSQPFTIQTDLQMCCILASAFGPSNSAGSWTEVVYVPDIISNYTDSFSTTTVGNGSYPGPSFCESPGSDTSTYYWTVCIQPVFSTSCTAGYYPVPLYFFWGNYENAYTPITTGTSTNLESWTILYGLNTSAENAGGNICGGSTGDGYNGLIGGFMGFPYYVSNSFTFMYFQVILVVPYFSGENFAGFVGQGNGTNTTYPGYVIAFYRRQGAYCTTTNTAPLAEATVGCTFNNDPSTLTNYYPVIYDSTNFNEQLTGNLTVEQTFNGFLQIATGNLSTTSVGGLFGNFYNSPSENLSTYLAGLGWLEGVNNGGGACFGSNSDGTYAGDNWYFCGFLPYNILWNSTSTDWAPTVPDITGANGSFASGNIVMATVENTAGTGNCFWDALDSTSAFEVSSSTTTPGGTQLYNGGSTTDQTNYIYASETALIFSGYWSCTGYFSNQSVPSFISWGTQNSSLELDVALLTNPYVFSLQIDLSFEDASTNNQANTLFIKNENYTYTSYGYLNNLSYGCLLGYSGDWKTNAAGYQTEWTNTGCFEYLLGPYGPCTITSSLC